MLGCHSEHNGSQLYSLCHKAGMDWHCIDIYIKLYKDGFQAIRNLSFDVSEKGIRDDN